MRRFFLSVLSCLLILNSFSQQYNNYLSLSLGPAIPVGKFASTNGNDPNSGLAKIGGLLDLSYIYRFHNSSFGISGSLRARINNINGKAFLSPLMNENPGYKWPDLHISWKAGAFMAGGYHTCALTKKISLDEELMFGLADAWLPAVNIVAIKSLSDFPGDADVLFANSQKTHALAFSSVLKVGASLRLTNRITLVANLDYWYLKPAFKNVAETVMIANGLNVPYQYTISNSRQPPTRYSYSVNNTQAMNSINLTAGAEMRF